MSNDKRTFVQILADTVGNLFGFTSVAAGATVIGASTLAGSAAAGATAAVAAKAYNMFAKEENQTNTYEKSVNAAHYVAETGCNLFEKSNPMLFSCGHYVGEKGVEITASAINATYNGGKELCGFGDPTVSFEEVEDECVSVDVKKPSSLLARLR